MNRSVALGLSLLLAAGAGAVTACSGNSARITSVAALTADTVSGKSLYTSNCASCHGSDGKSASGKKNIVSATTSNTSGAIDTMLSGDGEMPDFANLSDQELANIVGYVKTL